jgi:hypothetical protein
MRVVLVVVSLLILAGCDKPIHEARVPIHWVQAAAH